MRELLVALVTQHPKVVRSLRRPDADETDDDSLGTDPATFLHVAAQRARPGAWK